MRRLRASCLREVVRLVDLRSLLAGARMSSRGSERPKVGDVIRWSSGGSVHTGTVVEVLRHGHVRVDNWTVVIPPGWIL